MLDDVFERRSDYWDARWGSACSWNPRDDHDGVLVVGCGYVLSLDLRGPMTDTCIEWNREVRLSTVTAEAGRGPGLLVGRPKASMLQQVRACT